MKKILLVLALTTAGAFNSYGWGIGAEGGWAGAWGWGYGVGNVGAVGLSIGFGELADPSSHLGVSFRIVKSGFGVSGHYDWALLNYNVTDWFGLYINAGIGASFGSWGANYFGGKTSYWNAGVVGRLPLGMRFMLVKHLELFLQLDPNLGLGMGGYSVKTNLGQGSNDFGVGFIGGVGATIGIRYWF